MAILHVLCAKQQAARVSWLTLVATAAIHRSEAETDGRSNGCKAAMNVVFQRHNVRLMLTHFDISAQRID